MKRRVPISIPKIQAQRNKLSCINTHPKTVRFEFEEVLKCIGQELR